VYSREVIPCTRPEYASPGLRETRNCTESDQRRRWTSLARTLWGQPRRFNATRR